ncbi:MAG: hypothetical protein JSC189_000042 [Candidatus Tokpelaia sp. JSC189]|nr:MAG: hypothetical protein JSC189_000042 [Candidatus Tokpelaia sp. JSC189]
MVALPQMKNQTIEAIDRAVKINQADILQLQSVVQQSATHVNVIYGIDSDGLARRKNLMVECCACLTPAMLKKPA